MSEGKLSAGGGAPKGALAATDGGSPKKNLVPPPHLCLYRTLKSTRNQPVLENDLKFILGGSLRTAARKTYTYLLIFIFTLSIFLGPSKINAFEIIKIITFYIFTNKSQFILSTAAHTIILNLRIP